MSDRKDVPVYLFTGFLESGKTKFIQETLEDKRFCNGERTMLLVCEEGEEEYAPDQFADKSVYIHVIEDQSELTAENLEKWLRESRAERVVVEYNGMWMLDVLYSAMPESWMVYQEFMFADAGTFLTYNNNMRQLVYDKLKSCELVVFNRFKPVLASMGSSVVLCGGIGAGNVTKLCNQTIVAVNIAVLAEAMQMGQMCGVEPQKIFEAIRGGLAGSTVMNAKAPMMMDQNFEPGFRIDLHIKDLKNVVDAASAVDAPIPLTQAVLEMMKVLHKDGCGACDHSALLKYYQKLTGEVLHH